MSGWTTDADTLLGLQNEQDFECYYCHVGLEFWGAKLLNFSLDGEEEMKAWAIDLGLVCPKCGLLQIFGVPIDTKHADTVKERLKVDPNHAHSGGVVSYDVGEPFK